MKTVRLERHVQKQTGTGTIGGRGNQAGGLAMVKGTEQMGRAGEVRKKGETRLSFRGVKLALPRLLREDL